MGLAIEEPPALLVPVVAIAGNGRIETAGYAPYLGKVDFTGRVFNAATGGAASSIPGQLI